ncbi:unnamed protein product [Dibothriocephalus latus]|uniref:Uncharacterized protein n=1 Tax=Dibothriocephalus latus TaxID=60516 RepID=A0A3P7LEA9_DIBLA|nr:unnamed protein product [Dibothriocephalus latus]
MDTIEELDEEDLGSPRSIKVTLGTTSAYKEESPKLSDDSLELTEICEKIGVTGGATNSDSGLAINNLSLCSIEKPQKTNSEHPESGAVQNDYTIIVSLGSCRLLVQEFCLSLLPKTSSY